MRSGFLLMLACWPLFFGCGESSPPPEKPRPEKVALPEPPIEEDDTVPLFHARHLSTKELKVGTGDPVGENAVELVVQLKGRLTGGHVFKDTRQEGRPLTFRPGRGEVVVGLERGVRGMRVGGKREVVVPPELGFREKKVGRVPPFSTLVYEVELIRFK